MYIYIHRYIDRSIDRFVYGLMYIYIYMVHVYIYIYIHTYTCLYSLKMDRFVVGVCTSTYPCFQCLGPNRAPNKSWVLLHLAQDAGRWTSTSRRKHASQSKGQSQRKREVQSEGKSQERAKGDSGLHGQIINNHLLLNY